MFVQSAGACHYARSCATPFCPCPKPRKILNESVNTNVSEEDRERQMLLDVVMNRGIGGLSRPELERLRELLERKDYGIDRKAQRSKKRLLKKISKAIYDYDKKFGNSFKTS